MKRLVSAFLAGAMALSLAACGGSASPSMHFYGCFFCRRLCRPGKLHGR